MTWSYLSSDPGSSDRSWVRLRVGDTSSESQQISDEEIDALLAAGSKYKVAANTARTLAAQFARKATKEVGKLKIAMGLVSRNYLELAKAIEAEANGMAGSAGMYAGGVTVSDKDLERDDSERVTSAISIGQFDHPGT